MNKDYLLELYPQHNTKVNMRQKITTLFRQQFFYNIPYFSI